MTRMAEKTKKFNDQFLADEKNDIEGNNQPSEKQFSISIDDGAQASQDSSSRPKRKAPYPHVLRTAQQSDTMQRQKRRKNMLGSNPVQLEVEVQNEGIVLLYRVLVEDKPKQSPSGASTPSLGSDKDNRDGQKSVDKREFIPWSMKAKRILYSIICGQIPDDIDTGFDPRSVGVRSFLSMFTKKTQEKMSGEIEGLLLKCMVSCTCAGKSSPVICEVTDIFVFRMQVTDMRTSDASARAQRGMALREKQLEIAKKHLLVLEKKSFLFNSKVTELEKENSHMNSKEAAVSQDVKTCKKKIDVTKKALSDISQKAKVLLQTRGPGKITNFLSLIIEIAVIFMRSF